MLFYSAVIIVELSSNWSIWAVRTTCKAIKLICSVVSECYAHCSSKRQLGNDPCFHFYCIPRPDHAILLDCLYSRTQLKLVNLSSENNTSSYYTILFLWFRSAMDMVYVYFVSAMGLGPVSSVPMDHIIIVLFSVKLSSNWSNSAQIG